MQAIASGAIGAGRHRRRPRRSRARRASRAHRATTQITVFKSVGFALEDLAAAEAVLDAAARPAPRRSSRHARSAVQRTARSAASCALRNPRSARRARRSAAPRACRDRSPSARPARRARRRYAASLSRRGGSSRWGIAGPPGRFDCRRGCANVETLDRRSSKVRAARAIDRLDEAPRRSEPEAGGKQRLRFRVALACRRARSEHHGSTLRPFASA